MTYYARKVTALHGAVGKVNLEAFGYFRSHAIKGIYSEKVKENVIATSSNSYQNLKDNMVRAAITEIDNTKDYMFQAENIALNNFHVDRTHRLADAFNHDQGRDKHNGLDRACYTCGERGHIAEQCSHRHPKTRVEADKT